jgi:hypothetical protein
MLDEILSAILPEGMLIPGAFEAVGHIGECVVLERWALIATTNWLLLLLLFTSSYEPER